VVPYYYSSQLAPCQYRRHLVGVHIWETNIVPVAVARPAVEAAPILNEWDEYRSGGMQGFIYWGGGGGGGGGGG